MLPGLRMQSRVMLQFAKASWRVDRRTPSLARVGVRGVIAVSDDARREFERKSESIKYWRELYKNKADVFTLKEVNDNLAEYFEELFPYSDKKLRRLLVPGCGKDVSLSWVADQPGFGAIGVDISDEPLRQLGHEELGGLKPILELPHMSAYQARHFPRLLLVHGDMLELDVDDFGGTKFEAIWDRAAMTSIAPDQRDAYARKLRSLIQDPAADGSGGGRMLLEFLATNIDVDGALDPAQTKRQLESAGFRVKQLKRDDVKSAYPGFSPPGLEFLEEVLLLCTAA